MNKLQIQTDILKHFVFNSDTFKSLKIHSTEIRNSLADHFVILSWQVNDSIWNWLVTN